MISRKPVSLSFVLVTSVLMAAAAVDAQLCEPAPDGFSCVPLACSPVPEDQCIGTVLRVDWATGAITMAECQCRDVNACHVEFGNVTPYPVGKCPAGHACEVHAWDADGDGTDDHFTAECVPAKVGVCCLDVDRGPVPYDQCKEIEELACHESGGVFHGVNTTCHWVQACCLPSPDGDSSFCADLSPPCCMDSGGIPQGPCSACYHEDGTKHVCGQICGGIAGIPCKDATEFCKLPEGGCCCDFLGVCTPRPGECPDVWKPVCGCDGVTYANECEAYVVGVSIFRRSACDSNCPDVWEPVCGVDGVTYANACYAELAGVPVAHKGECGLPCDGLGPHPPCPDGQFCKHEMGQCHDGYKGVCTPFPPECSRCYEPVCGCDGVTYPNECQADRAGVSVAHLGECKPNACCFPDGYCINLLPDLCMAEGGVPVPGVPCEAVDCGPPPTGACCLYDPAGGVTCLVSTAAECQDKGGEYLGDGTTCSSDPDQPCGPPIGACCLPDNTCLDDLPADLCLGANGQPFPGGRCANVDCDAIHTGACCFPTPDATKSSCLILTPFGCKEMGGAYQGDHTTCPCEPQVCGGIAGIPCDDPATFCKFPEGTCGVGDIFGHCAPTPQGCPDEWDPVCGCDGKTYGNECEADTAGASIAHRGECKPNACCLPNGACVDLPPDPCRAEGGQPVPGVPCDVVFCEPVAIGACCVNNSAGVASCFVGTEADCFYKGGDYQGHGTTCPTNQDVCALPSDIGPCDGICPRFFYNTCTGQCESFDYGCCGGNANNFLTLAECTSACMADEHVCLLPPDPGDCAGACPRYYYDACTGRCESFMYGCCGGNANNFETLPHCERVCPPVATTADCGLFTGACCLNDPAGVTSCFVDIEANCLKKGGKYQGDGTTCPSDPNVPCGWPCDFPCPPGEDCFTGCGVIVQGAYCILFQADSGDMFILSNLGGFQVGDRVFVTGCYLPFCDSFCMQGEACMHDNTIKPCEPQVCGGIAGIPCEAPGTFCKFPEGTCGEWDLFGLCTPIPDKCLATLWDPVCGCDGVTYQNECHSDAAGVSIRHRGECETVCLPTDDGTGCIQPVCSPVIEAYCFATAVRLDEATGTYRVERCDCLFFGECHIDLRDGELVGVGACADGALCQAVGVDTDNNGIDDLFTPECTAFGACCFDVGGIPTPLLVCEDTPAHLCEGEWVIFEGPGTTCETAAQACCLPYGKDYCSDVGPRCCMAYGGVPQGPGSTCAAVIEQGGCPQFCGGIGGHPCGEGEFCKTPVGECGSDFQGICTPMPQDCPEYYKPVCGCDRVTYDNECFADAAGVSVAHPGRCEKICGGFAGNTCNDDEFCKFPEGVCNDAVDHTGICVPVPGECPAIHEPVCGCDNVTYSNECYSDRARVSVLHRGECEVHPCAATRVSSDLAMTYCPGVTKMMHIVLTPPMGASAVALEDSPPAGWVVGHISNDGTFDAVNGKVKWGPFFAPSIPPAVSYSVTPPADENGLKCFAGTVSVDGLNQPVCGKECLDRFCCPHMDADTPQSPCDACTVGDCTSCDDPGCSNGQVTMCELAGYACAWMKGCNDDMAGMTRAAYIWRNGECYCWDDGAQNWFPTPCANVAGGCCGGTGLPGEAIGEIAVDRPSIGGAVATVRSVRVDPRSKVWELSFPITIEAPEGASAMALEIHVPKGWKVTGISDGGEWDRLHHKIKWGPFVEDLSRTVSFTALRTADSQTSTARRFRGEPQRFGPSGFSGTVSFDGVNQPITAD